MGSLATLLLWIALALPDAAEVDAALRRVLADDEYQTSMPVPRTEPLSPATPAARRGREPQTRQLPPPVPARPARERPERSGTGRSRWGRADDMAPIGPVLFWILVSVFAVAVGVYVVRDIQARRLAKEALGKSEKAAKSPAAPVAGPIPEHERLALAGRHAEAIHAILLEVLAAIGAARAGLRPAWTSREILSIAKLEQAAQAALASLVGLVEVTRFGGAQVREQEYRNAVLWLGTIGGAAR